MRVLLTGADGYIGAVMGPKLIAAGHDVTGLDTGFYRRGWLFDDGRTHPRSSPRTCARSPSTTSRLRRRRPPRRALQRPDRRERPRADHGDQPPGLGAPRREGARRRRQALRLRLVLRDLRRRRRRDAHRESALAPQTAYARCKILVESDVRALADDGLHPDLHAQRHRLRRLAAPALRHRPQQPLRLRPHHRRDPHDQRRLAVAADRPHRGHLPGDDLRARGAAARRSPARSSTSAPTRRTTASARSPRSSRGPSPAAR